MAELQTIVKGKIGYNICEKFLLKNGFDIYVPILENTKIDAIIIKDNKLFKIQVKTIGKARGQQFLPVRKLSNNRGENKQKHYTADDIDFFIGVDIDTEDIYIVPIEKINQYNSAIAVGKLEKFKNNISILS